MRKCWGARVCQRWREREEREREFIRKQCPYWGFLSWHVGLGWGALAGATPHTLHHRRVTQPQHTRLQARS